MTALVENILARWESHAAEAAAEIGGDSISARVLLRMFEDIRRELRDVGVRPGDLVLVLAERSIWIPVALLAIWSQGAGFLLLDRKLPERMVDRTIAETRPGFVVRVSRSSYSVSGRSQGRVLPEGCSHLARTSGTTGSPRFVVTSSDSFEASITAYVERVRGQAASRVAFTSRIGYDPMLRDVMVPWLAEGLLIAPGDLSLESVPGALGRFVERTQPSLIHTTPAAIRFGRLRSPQPESAHLTIVCGGARLPTALVRRLYDLSDRWTVVNAYGATETPQVASSFSVTSGWLAESSEETVPIGVGVGDRIVALLRELPFERPVDGRDDEIVVLSSTLSEGYLDNPGETAKRFLRIDGRDCYRTGDVGIRNGSGELICIGRIDRELSINGFRIVPEEIESLAREMPGIEAALVDVESIRGADRLLLTVASRIDGVEAQMLEHLAANLPGYAVPARVTVDASLRDSK